MKIKVKVIGNDSLIESMFTSTKFGGNEYVIIKDDQGDPDLACFIGGADVNPKLYNESLLDETYYDIKDDERDCEAYTKYKDIPKVGICRGGQFLNVMSGGKMWQDVNNHGCSHEVMNLLPMDSRGYKSGTSFLVTSTHHQMMVPGESGEVLACVYNKEKNTGRSTVFKSAVKREKPSFDTEVVWYRSTNSLCFQPHPEYRSIDDTKDYFFCLLEYFWFGDSGDNNV